MQEKRTIAETLKPTFENVTREFITGTMYEILYSNEIPNFQFEFREKEANEFVNNVLQQYIKEYEQYNSTKQKAIKTLEGLKQKNDGIKPVLIINDYKEFFENLRKYYEEDIKLFFKRSECSGFPVYEQRNCFEEIWLRATPDDFNNPEKFLKKNAEMLKDNTFEKYDKETYFGKLECLDNNIICIKNAIARTWDENSKQIEINIYDKNYYNTEMFDRPHYELPVIRYGIYEKAGKKVCQIGSIQNKNFEEDKNSVYKKVERKKYSLNEGIDKEDIISIEPKNIISLSIFINLLHKEGITDLEVPGMYVLDYEYHQKRADILVSKFREEWNEEEIQEYPERYQRHLKEIQKTCGKEDLISEIKTERFLRTFKRLTNHYSKSNVTAYACEQDSYMHINIPVAKSENEINGDILKEAYKLVNKKEELER